MDFEEKLYLQRIVYSNSAINSSFSCYNKEYQTKSSNLELFTERTAESDIK
jgi:hypothetical protein